MSLVASPLVFLIGMLYAWLPPTLSLCVIAVIGTAFLAICIKILIIIFDFLFKFIDIFI